MKTRRSRSRRTTAAAAARAPRVPSRARNPTRTRQRILRAALDEFSGKGFTGARVDAIARAATINKRMLYHYFGNKEELFREVLRHKLAERAGWLAGSPLDPVDLLPYWFDLSGQDPHWIRLLQWEALQPARKGWIDEDRRREAMARGVAKLRQRQERGLLAKQWDPRHVLLSHMSLTMFPVAFPQLTWLILGCTAADPRFIRERRAYLRQVAERLYGSGNLNGATRPKGGRTAARKGLA